MKILTHFLGDPSVYYKSWNAFPNTFMLPVLMVNKAFSAKCSLGEKIHTLRN